MVTLLPENVTFPATIEQALTWLVEQMYAWDWLIPVDTLFLVLSFAAGLYTALFGVSGLRWLLNLVRGAGA